MRKNTASILAPFLTAAFPIFYVYAANVYNLEFAEVFRALLFGQLAALVLLAIFSLLIRSLPGGAFLTACFMLLFFTYGHLQAILARWIPLDLYAFGWHWILVGVWLALLGFAILTAIRQKSRLSGANRYLAIFGGLMLVPSLYTVGVDEFFERQAFQPEWLSGVDTGELQLSNPQQPPDIYYLIFDEYSRADVLRDHYGYDDSAFIDSLTNRGFYVASASRSNYPHTPLSLSSSLNMAYLDEVASALGPDSTDVRVAFDLIEDSLVMQALRASGYRFVHVSSGWGVTERNSQADVEVYDPAEMTYFERALGFSTWLSPAMSVVVYNGTRARMLTNFDAVSHVPEMDGPIFIFAHFVLPHGPYVFEADEGPLPPDGESVDGVIVDEDAFAQHKDYLGQVGFANRYIRQVVDDVLASSETPPIILIQADHGPRLAEWGQEEYDVNVLPILNAYYLPDGGQDALYPSISPVNSFRVIFDTYFGTRLGLLDDKSYYASPERPYDMFELPPH